MRDERPTVWLLWETLSDEHHTDRLVGVFSSEATALAAQEKLCRYPSFMQELPLDPERPGIGEAAALPHGSQPDRLMSSVMSLARDAVCRVEEFRAGVAQMLHHEAAGGEGWWRGWEMCKSAYHESAPHE